MIGILAVGTIAEDVTRNLRDPWSLVGFLGQIVFGARFVLQWIASERAKKVVVPAAFWWLSIVGAAITLVYVTYRRDPVMIVANLVNFAIYGRNLALRGRGTPPEAGAAA